jgi:hypothetical protein
MRQQVYFSTKNDKEKGGTLQIFEAVPPMVTDR